MSDEEILTVLQSEGYTIQDWKLKQIRKDMGLFRKVQGAENLEESNTQLRTAIAAELDCDQVKQYGREFFYRHLRTQRIPVARNRMFALMKELDPVGVEEQCKDAYNRHGTFQVPGPNFLWSIDGHL